MTLSCAQLKLSAINFLRQMKENKEWSFRFSGSNSGNLIGSSLAVMLAGVSGWLNTLSQTQRRNWAAYLASFQNNEGFFEDEDISDQNRVPGYTRERALFHRTRHALFALSTLGYRPRKEFSFLNDLRDVKNIGQWLNELNLSNFWDASNKIMDMALFLTYEAVQGKNRKSANAVRMLLDFCDEHTNPETGYQESGKSELRNAMAGAMHIYPIYFLWGRKPKFPGRVLETTLSLQQPDGLFGYETGTCGEDCLDYDAVCILVNLSFISSGLDEKIKIALQKLLRGIIKCRNTDGGFCCHRRKEPYRFGTFSTQVPVGGSSLWSTYARIVTIAMAAKILKDNPAAGEWNLGNNLFEIWDGGTGLMSDYNNFDKLEDV